MRKNTLWIVFDDKSDILFSFCSCTAGFGACCNHVVAAMYKVEFANEKGLTDPACTDVLCYWNSASKDIAPMKVKNMEIVQHNQKKQTKKSTVSYKEKVEFDPRPECHKTVCDKRRKTFLGEVRKILPNAVVLKSFQSPKVFVQVIHHLRKRG